MTQLCVLFVNFAKARQALLHFLCGLCELCARQKKEMVRAEGAENAERRADIDHNPPLQGEVPPARGRRGVAVSGEVSGFGVHSAGRDTPPSRKGAPPPLQGEDFRGVCRRLYRGGDYVSCL